MRARELAAWSAANTLADAVRVAIERLDGPASVRNPAEALDILQTAIGIAQAGIDIVHDRATGPIVETPEPPVDVQHIRQQLSDFYAGRIQAEVVGQPMRGASS